MRRPVKGLLEDDRQLLLAMREIHRQEKRRAGSRRIVKKLKERNLHVGRHRVRRLMREDGMIAKRTRAWRNPPTTDSNHDQPSMSWLHLRVRTFAINVCGNHVHDLLLGSYIVYMNFKASNRHVMFERQR